MFHLHSLTFEFQCLHAYLYIELSSLRVLLVKFIVLVIVIWISIHSIYTYSSQFLYCLCRIELNYSAYINCQWIDNFICVFFSEPGIYSKCWTYVHRCTSFWWSQIVWNIFTLLVSCLLNHSLCKYMCSFANQAKIMSLSPPACHWHAVCGHCTHLTIQGISLQQFQGSSVFFFFFEHDGSRVNLVSLNGCQGFIWKS